MKSLAIFSRMKAWWLASRRKPTSAMRKSFKRTYGAWAAKYPYDVDIPIGGEDEVPPRLVELLAWGKAHATRAWVEETHPEKRNGEETWVAYFHFASEADAAACRKRWLVD